jgi:hypothetical protein
LSPNSPACRCALVPFFSPRRHAQNGNFALFSKFFAEKEISERGL